MDSITLDNVEEIERKYLAGKRAKRLGKPVVDEEDEAPAKPKTTRGKGKKKTPAVGLAASALHDAYDAYMPTELQDYMPSWDDQGPSASAEEIAEYEKEMKKIGGDALKINQYYKAFPQCAPPRAKTWTGNDNPDHIRAELERCRAVVNGEGAQESLVGMVCGAAQGFEWLTHTYGYNPAGLNVKGLGQGLTMACHSPDKPLEPELTQLSIEYSDYLASSPEWRLAFKLFKFVQAYNALNSNPELRAAIEKAQAVANAQQVDVPAAVPVAAKKPSAASKPKARFSVPL